MASFVVVAGTAGVTYLLYKNELGRVRDASSRGSSVANLDVGPIEYAETGAGIFGSEGNRRGQ